MKIFDTYPGGKGSDGTYQTVINLIPPHEVFVSGFLGNCAVMRYKRPAATNIGVDIDRSVIEAWKQAGAKSEDLFGPTFIPILPGDKPLVLYGCSFLEYLTRWGYALDNPDTFIYLDPPYPIPSRKSGSKIYNHEMTIDDHVQLLTAILSMRSMVMIQTYDNDLYREYLKDWNKVNYPTKTRRGVVIETAYMKSLPVFERNAILEELTKLK